MQDFDGVGQTDLRCGVPGRRMAEAPGPEHPWPAQGTAGQGGGQEQWEGGRAGKWEGRSQMASEACVDCGGRVTAGFGQRSDMICHWMESKAVPHRGDRSLSSPTT